MYPTDAFKALCVALYVIGAALPLIGLTRIFFRLKRDLPPANRTSGTEMLADFEAVGTGPVAMFAPAVEHADKAPKQDYEKARADITFVGLGIVSATAASIISLYIPADITAVA